MSTTDHPAAPDVAAPTEPEDPAYRWLHNAALALGAEAAVAQAFAQTGRVQLNDVLLWMQPRSDKPDDWLAIARVERPAGVDHERWCNVLLEANGSLMLLAPWTFAIDDDGAALLALRVPPAHCDDPLMLCGSLFGLLYTAEGLVHGVLEPQVGGASTPTPAQAADPIDAREIDAAIEASTAQPAFTPPMQALIRRAVAALGGDAAAQQQALEQRVLRVGGAPIAVVADIEGHALVASADVGQGALAGTQEAAAVLAGNLDLMALAGVALGRLAGRPALMGRWDLDEAADDVDETPAEVFAAWLIDFAELSLALSAAGAGGRHNPAVRRPA